MDHQVAEAFEAYPGNIKARLLDIRKAIFDVAKDDNIAVLEEALKWGQPSYLTKIGSTIRLGADSKPPSSYAIFFHCQTTLVDTFRQVHGNLFNYQGNRAIVFSVTDDVPLTELKHCISLALRYHKVKHLPLLGC